MVDLATTSALTAIGYPLVQKVLGPSAEYLGDQFKLFSQKNVDNIKNIFEKVDARELKENNPQASVNPQIIKDIVFNASYCENEITQEYYAGLLISSKNENSLDDRGKTISSIINQLSSYQISAHYFLYGIAEAMGSKGSSIHDKEHYFVDNYQLLESGLCYKAATKDESKAILEHVFYGLNKYDLVSGIDGMNRSYGLDADGQYHYHLTPSGIELFLWANGAGKKHIDFFFLKEFSVFKHNNIDFDKFI